MQQLQLGAVKATANSCLLLAKVLLVSMWFARAARNHRTQQGALYKNSNNFSKSPHTHARICVCVGVCTSGRKFVQNLHIYSIRLSACLQVHWPYPFAICLQAEQHTAPWAPYRRQPRLFVYSSIQLLLPVSMQRAACFCYTCIARWPNNIPWTQSAFVQR